MVQYRTTSLAFEKKTDSAPKLKCYYDTVLVVPGEMKEEIIMKANPNNIKIDFASSSLP